MPSSMISDEEGLEMFFAQLTRTELEPMDLIINTMIPL